MNIDLNDLSRKELEKLQQDVKDALNSLDQRKKLEARRAAETIAKEHGFSLEDLLVQDRKGAKSPPKYRHPDDLTKTWTGRGRQPEWIKAGLAEGRQLSDFLI
ncbi:hypothetical protein LCGC14_1772300 [marine sediment metagenome]|uniref:DNA-binding protein H-NS-like C-terminal domain-containing protein n=1 Tax=marine sediment metagenome TaxID=412755 RepID=A0A0F9JCS0_9ZZZZ